MTGWSREIWTGLRMEAMRCRVGGGLRPAEEDTRRMTATRASADGRLALGRVSTPGGDRTPDLLVRSQALCPAELRAHLEDAAIFISG
jgi:hypothetical protein